MHDQTPLKAAYRVAKEILDSRDGAGFRFIVTMNNGASFDVTPLDDDPLDYPDKDRLGNALPGWHFWECQHGENFLVLRHAEIAAIEVYEC